MLNANHLLTTTVKAMVFDTFGSVVDWRSA